MEIIKNSSRIIQIAFKGIALVIAVAVGVTSILGKLDARNQILLLGIGLFALAITLLDV